MSSRGVNERKSVSRSPGAGLPGSVSMPTRGTIPRAMSSTPAMVVEETAPLTPTITTPSFLPMTAFPPSLFSHVGAQELLALVVQDPRELRLHARVPDLFHEPL